MSRGRVRGVRRACGRRLQPSLSRRREGDGGHVARLHHLKAQHWRGKRRVRAPDFLWFIISLSEDTTSSSPFSPCTPIPSLFLFLPLLPPPLPCPSPLLSHFSNRGNTKKKSKKNIYNINARWLIVHPTLKRERKLFTRSSSAIQVSITKNMNFLYSKQGKIST